MMQNVPTNLIPTLARLITVNRRGPIMQDSPDLQAVRDMLEYAGHIKHIDLGDCYVDAGSIEAQGYELCPGCGTYMLSPGDDLCPDCIG